MRIAVAVDELVGVAAELPAALRARGHEVIGFGALADAPSKDDWVGGSAAAAAAVASGDCDQAVVACWTGTGASIAANKVAGVRAALCTDAVTADGARRWNDANCLVLSLRLTAPAVLEEILDAWLGGVPSQDPVDTQNLERLAALEERVRHTGAARGGPRPPTEV